MPSESMETPPHPLDGAFANCSSDKAINEGLLNNAHYLKAVAAAKAAFADQAARIQEAEAAGNPIRTGSPSHSARNAFLKAVASV